MKHVSLALALTIGTSFSVFACKSDGITIDGSYEYTSFSEAKYIAKSMLQHRCEKRGLLLDNRSIEVLSQSERIIKDGERSVTLVRVALEGTCY